MSLFLTIHPQDPQLRLIRQVVNALENGAIIAYPTDCAYALGCIIGNKAALDRIRLIRQLKETHNFTLICHNLAELSTYARVENPCYRLLKAYTPGAYTFILPATRDVPKRLQHPKRKTVGIRIPDNKIVAVLLEELKKPIMSTSLILPNDEHPLTDPDEIYDRLGNQVDIVIDGGVGETTQTTIIDCISSEPQLVRAGKGDTAPFL